MKHKIGKRERATLEKELEDLTAELKRLDEKDEDGFILFYYDAEGNGKKVEQLEWIHGVLKKGFYYK